MPNDNVNPIFQSVLNNFTKPITLDKPESGYKQAKDKFFKLLKEYGYDGIMERLLEERVDQLMKALPLSAKYEIAEWNFSEDNFKDLIDIIEEHKDRIEREYQEQLDNYNKFGER